MGQGALSKPAVQWWLSLYINSSRRGLQAPTLRTLGCAIARKYDYKSSKLYSQSSHGRSTRAFKMRHRRTSHIPPNAEKQGREEVSLAGRVSPEIAVRSGGWYSCRTSDKSDPAAWRFAHRPLPDGTRPCLESAGLGVVVSRRMLRAVDRPLGCIGCGVPLRLCVAEQVTSAARAGE